MGVDLRERRQLDMAEQVARVKARTRPWRSIIAVVLAIAAAAVSHAYGISAHRHGKLTGAGGIEALTTSADGLIALGTAIAFFLFGVGATMGLAGKTRDGLQPRIGSTHASLVRIVFVLAGLIATVSVTLQLFGLPVTQLILGGAILGVLLGIAAQQTLANLFAGIVLLQAHPFVVGDLVWIRSGALGGQYEGEVTEIGLTYVRLTTGDGPVSLPNTQVLAAATGPVKPAQPDRTRSSTAA
jgi:small-conductance mechanosensitive channel